MHGPFDGDEYGQEGPAYQQRAANPQATVQGLERWRDGRHSNEPESTCQRDNYRGLSWAWVT